MKKKAGYFKQIMASILVVVTLISLSSAWENGNSNHAYIINPYATINITNNIGSNISENYTFYNVTSTVFCFLNGECITTWPTGSGSSTNTDNYTTGIVFSGTSTKTLNLTMNNGTTYQASFTDIDTDTTYSSLSEFINDVGYVTNISMNKSQDCSLIDGATSNLCTIVDTDTDTTYTEDSKYLTLTGTTFSFLESLLNDTIDSRSDFNTDSQTLSFIGGDNISISGGNSINISSIDTDTNTYLSNVELLTTGDNEQFTFTMSDSSTIEVNLTDNNSGGGADGTGGWTNNTENTTTLLNVGIGLTNPTTPLEVVGNILSNSTIYIGDTAPSNLYDGMFWQDTGMHSNLFLLKVYRNSEWVVVLKQWLSSTTFNLTNSMNSSEIQSYFDIVDSSVIPTGIDITYQFADGTYTLTGSGFIIGGVSGGGVLYFKGNSGELSKASSKSVVLDFTDNTGLVYGFNFKGNIAEIRMYALEIHVVTSTYNSAYIYSSNGFRTFVQYCVGESSSTTTGDGWLFHGGGIGRVSQTYAKAGYSGIRASENGIVYADHNAPGSVQPKYGMRSHGGVIRYVGTYITGSVADTLVGHTTVG